MMIKTFYARVGTKPNSTEFLCPDAGHEQQMLRLCSNVEKGASSAWCLTNFILLFSQLLSGPSFLKATITVVSNLWHHEQER